MDSLTLADLNEVAAEVKLTGKCTNLTILKLERHIQIVASQTPYSFARCACLVIHIKALIISDGMPVLKITLNPSDFRSFLILVLAGMHYENSDPNNSTE